MQCESGGNQNNIGDVRLQYLDRGQLYGYSVGLLQIRELPGRPAKDWLLDPTNNVRYGAQLYHAHQWAPWTCATILGIK